MNEGIATNNRIVIKGYLDTPLEFSHRLYGEGFYSCVFRVPRLSESCEYLQVTISERLYGSAELAPGEMYCITGQLRSYNKYIDNVSRLILTIFAQKLEPCEGEPMNEIELSGYVCKEPIYRTTPFKREITDMLIAVNRSYNKSDYIPCITWSRNARYATKLEVGQKVSLCGRMQSSIYEKSLPDGNVIERTAYEVSVSRLELCE